MRREYDLVVTHKQAGGLGDFRAYSLTLMQPNDQGQVYDIHRPFWLDRTTTGAPVWLDVDREEFEATEIGQVIRVTIEAMTTVAKALADRG